MSDQDPSPTYPGTPSFCAHGQNPIPPLPSEPRVTGPAPRIIQAALEQAKASGEDRPFFYTKQDWEEIGELCRLNEQDWAVLLIKFERYVMSVRRIVMWLQVIERVRNGEPFGLRKIDSCPVVLKPGETSASRAEWSERE